MNELEAIKNTLLDAHNKKNDIEKNKVEELKKLYPIFQKRFGDLIAKYRKLRNFTQEELASMTNVDHRYISSLERGKVNPSFSLMVSLFAILEIDKEDVKDIFFM